MTNNTSTRATDTIIRRTVTGALIAGTVLAVGAATAHADHIHSVRTGNGACVLLAHDGGENEVELPFATQAQIDADRAHPIHLLVHLGRPGQNIEIGVYGTASDPCFGTDDYLND
ncbi:MAG TPA: hypothetical protein VK917_03720 [Ilumatobacter sp.]|nr:hypothetical protein [Ilumatobacter sp.]